MMNRLTGLILVLSSFICLPVRTQALPNPASPNGLPCMDGKNYRDRMIGPWDPARYDGDPVGIRYSPRWDIFYYAQCIDPATPGALGVVLGLVIEDGMISKPGCDAGRAIRFDRNGALQLCAEEDDSYVTIRGTGPDAQWVVGYYSNGAPAPIPLPGPGPRPSPAPAPRPGPAPAPKPKPAPPRSKNIPGAPFVIGTPTDANDYFIGDDDRSHCPEPDPTHPYRELMFGFDLSRLESAAHTPKYAFAQLAQDLPPTDSCMRVIADTLGPSMGCLDIQDNFMLDVTRDGYIGYRTWSPGYAHWSWFGYNDAHPDPGDAGSAGRSPNCGRYTGPIVYQK